MKAEPMASLLGAGGGTEEPDETYVGGKVRSHHHKPKGPNAGKKAVVFTAINREGDVRTSHLLNARKDTAGERAVATIKAAPGKRLTYRAGANSLIGANK